MFKCLNAAYPWNTETGSFMNLMQIAKDQTTCNVPEFWDRVATYHPSQNSLTFPCLFPDILQFSIPSDR